jgi:hypothetical protein
LKDVVISEEPLLELREGLQVPEPLSISMVRFASAPIFRPPQVDVTNANAIGIFFFFAPFVLFFPHSSLSFSLLSVETGHWTSPLRSDGCGEPKGILHERFNDGAGTVFPRCWNHCGSIQQLPASPPANRGTQPSILSFSQFFWLNTYECFHSGEGSHHENQRPRAWHSSEGQERVPEKLQTSLLRYFLSFLSFFSNTEQITGKQAVNWLLENGVKLGVKNRDDATRLGQKLHQLKIIFSVQKDIGNFRDDKGAFYSFVPEENLELKLSPKSKDLKESPWNSSFGTTPKRKLSEPTPPPPLPSGPNAEKYLLHQIIQNRDWEMLKKKLQSKKVIQYLNTMSSR